MALASASLEGVAGPTAKVAGGNKRSQPFGDAPQAIQNLVDKYGEQQVAVLSDENTGSGNGSDNFPVDIWSRDPRDRVMAIKYAMPKEAGQKILTTEDMQWYAQKDDELRTHSFRVFVANLLEQSGPAERARLLELYPSLLQEQLRVIDRRLDLERRIAHIRAGGIRSKEDIELMFAIQTGQVKPPKGKAWDPQSWELDKPEKVINRGLMSFSLWGTVNETAARPNDMFGFALGRGKDAKPTGKNQPLPWYTGFGDSTPTVGKSVMSGLMDLFR